MTNKLFNFHGFSHKEIKNLQEQISQILQFSTILTHSSNPHKNILSSPSPKVFCFLKLFGHVDICVSKAMEIKCNT